MGSKLSDPSRVQYIDAAVTPAGSGSVIAIGRANTRPSGSNEYTGDTPPSSGGASSVVVVTVIVVGAASAPNGISIVSPSAVASVVPSTPTTAVVTTHFFLPGFFAHLSPLAAATHASVDDTSSPGARHPAPARTITTTTPVCFPIPRSTLSEVGNPPPPASGMGGVAAMPGDTARRSAPRRCRAARATAGSSGRGSRRGRGSRGDGAGSRRDSGPCPRSTCR